jgi:hypothetical protein
VWVESWVERVVDIVEVVDGVIVVDREAGSVGVFEDGGVIEGESRCGGVD